MDLEIINRLYLELSQVATAKTQREIEAEEIIRTIGTFMGQHPETWTKAMKWLQGLPNRAR